MKTLAAVLIETNKPLVIHELELPELQAGQVLVDIKYSGVCHSQLNEIRGRKGPDKFLPHTLGHEGSGIVAAVGKGVSKVKVGDPVVLTWIKGKGSDVASAYYLMKDGTKVNSGAISTFLTKAVISENRLVKIDKKIGLKEAALLGCAVPTGAGIIFNTLKAESGKSIAIFGIGGVGTSALVAAVMAGCSNVIAVDVLDSKLAAAKEFGATHTVNVLKQDALKEIMTITGNKGVDYAVEASGKKIAMEAAFSAVRAGGGICVLAGNLSHGDKITIDPFELIKGKRIIGTWGGETDPDRDIPMYADKYLEQKLPLGKMLAGAYELKDINKAFDELEKGIVGRAVIELR